MNILYIAYSCNPYEGSEDKIGWCVPIESAKDNSVTVVTKEEQRPYITSCLKDNPLKNIEFYYVDIPEVYKRFFTGFLYSGRLNIWNKLAFPLVKKICDEKHIDIIHQITPIEFRAIGDYGRIRNVKFVCGPLGGGEAVPKGLLEYTKGHRALEMTRFLVNNFYRYKLRFLKKLETCDYVMFANKETRAFLKNRVGDNSGGVVFDNGLRTDELVAEHKSNDFVFLSVGRLIYRKGYDFLLDVLLRMPRSLEYEVRIVGDGPELDRLRKRCKNNKYLSSHVSFIGGVPYTDIEKEYFNASAFIMPSIRETTGTVLLEAMSKDLPVIALNKFGAATIFDEKNGWLVDGDSKETYIENFKNAIVECITHPDEREKRGKIARKCAEKYTWQEKNRHYQEIYRYILNN